MIKITPIYLEIATICIKIEFQFVGEKPWIHEYFSSAIRYRYKEYISEVKKTVNFTISVRFSKRAPEVYVDKESKKTYIEYSQYLESKKIITYYHVSLMAFNEIILEILDSELSSSKGFILHASSILYKNKGYIFLAESGGGKSTIAQIAKGKAKIINDDTIAIKLVNNESKIFTLPELSSIVSKHRVKKVEGFAIENIFFIKKSNKWKLRPFKKNEKKNELFMKQLLTKSENKVKSISNLLSFINIQMNKVSVLHFPKKPYLRDFTKVLKASHGGKF